MRATKATGRATGAGIVSAVLWALATAVPAAAGGDFASVYGGTNPLNAIGNFDPSAFVAADFDGDGDLDIAGREQTGDATIDYHRNNGNGTFTQLTGAANPFAGISFAGHSQNFTFGRLLVGDFDGDGDIDLWHHAWEGATFYENAAGTFVARSGAGDPLAELGSYDASTYVAADFDGDGDIDVAAREPVADSSIDFFRNDGTGVFTKATGADNPFAGITFGPAGNFTRSRVLVGDFDSDGDIDVWHGGNNTHRYYRNDSATFTELAGAANPLAGLASYDADSYVAGDFDADGDIDVAVREPLADETIDFFANNGDGTFTQRTGAANPFDAITFLPLDFARSGTLVGDFDGDGDVDLYNQAVNELYVQAGSAPVLLTTAPETGTGDVLRTTTLTLTFSEPVTPGNGTLTIRDAVTHAVLARLDTTTDAARFDGAGTATMTVEPAAPLPFARAVQVFVSPGAIVSATDGDAFAGIEHPAVFAFTTAANTAPVLGALDGDTATFVEGGGDVALDAGAPATVQDTDSPTFDGGSITVTITANGTAAEDELRIDDAGGVSLSAGHTIGSEVRIAGVAAGTLSAGGTDGSDLAIALDAGATPTRVASLLGALRYRNTNTADPATAERTITITVVDGDGGSATAHTTVSVVAVNDAPSITGPSTLAVDEDGASPIDGFAFADPDAANAPVTLTLGVSSGTLHAAPAVGVARTGAGTATLMLEGDLDALASALAAHAVTFSAATGDTADVTLTVTLHDHGNTGTGGPKTATLLVTLTVQPGAPAPPAQAPPPEPEPVPEEPATPPAAATPPPSAATTPPPPAAPATTAPAPVPDPQPLPEPAPVRPARDQSSGVPAPAVPDANAPMPAPVNAARASAEATVRRSHGVPAWPAAPIAGAFLLLLVVLVRRRRDDTAR